MAFISDEVKSARPKEIALIKSKIELEKDLLKRYIDLLND